jgi:polyisoprenyl-teichoic acid--peptidoglycan teichoic acid transferase
MTVRRVVYRSRPRWQSVIGWVFFSIVVLTGFAALGTYIGLRTKGFGHRVEFLAPAFGGKEVVYILAMGEDDTTITDKRPRGLTDTLILTKVDFTNKRIAAISIPRDTRIEMPGYVPMKINGAHVLGGPMLTVSAVQQITGVKPDYYVKTNLKGFRKSVDILGGVWIDVEKDMHYTDTWGHLYIDLKKGRQLMNGEHAMEYVRFRHDALGDITRMQRQQKFLKAFVARLLSPLKLPKLPWVVSALMAEVDTDMTTRDGIALAELAKGMDLNELKMATLPATPQRMGKISYMIQDVPKTQELVQQMFFPKPPMPKVEVLNGSGIPGAAQKVADALKQSGYVVTKVGNAGRFEYASTEVIGHKGEAGVTELAALVNSTTVKQVEDKTAIADVTVIVGRDCTLINNHNSGT